MIPLGLSFVPIQVAAAARSLHVLQVHCQHPQTMATLHATPVDVI